MGVIFQLINFYFWLHWVFVAAHGLSLAVTSRGYSLSVQTSHCGSFPCCGARARGHLDFSHCCLSSGLCIREAGGLVCGEEVSELPRGVSWKPGLFGSAWMSGQAVCALCTLSMKYWTCPLTGFCRSNELM